MLLLLLEHARFKYCVIFLFVVIFILHDSLVSEIYLNVLATELLLMSFETLIVLVLTTLNISNDPIGSLVTNWNFTLKRDRSLKFEGDSKSNQMTNKG